ncbi:lipopolysaccharide biosynthesis protein [Chryseobacterium sp. C-71]|uniref:lipopolysaccharide biosynthesis protein n=1 Tax=Chryseobacterium sp. C-71 TaxID=2893882 RepID=UPI001E308BB7|nr:lipopolysaccharide biosynthesis protein [Chryseobacterium sp. C-71]UFH32245.1 lipopolysaccharide biosynthesis protein [Chryseobacterium sp. C-71]
MSSSKIAKNTLYLYIRMLFNMGISLFTSRLILQTLGVEDFGIYNLVGGVVVLFSFLNNAMSNSTQRFLNIEIARGVKNNINRVFNISLKIHIIISIMILILSETVGLWFLNDKLNIPTNRMHAAHIVYQMSIITTVINVMRIPFNAIILANERMSFYAFLGIGETILKLVIVYMLLWFSRYDHLIVYSVLLMTVNLLVNIFYRIYCRINFLIETKWKVVNDKGLFKQMISFSGWNLFGQVAVLGSTQGINMILNIFVGVTVNAALGIANQVNGVIYNFISNMQVAFNPKIIQTHAEGQIDEHKNLVLNASKYSTYLFLLFAMPILVYTEVILHLWLGNNLPPYVVSFTQIVIVGSLINSIVGPFWMSANAIGNIRNYQIIISCILLFNLPIAYILLKNDQSPVFVMAIQVFLNFIAFIFRICYVNSKLSFGSKKLINYFKGFILPFLFVAGITYKSGSFVTNNLLQCVGIILLLEILLVMFILFSLSKSELQYTKQIIKKKLKRN